MALDKTPGKLYVCKATHIQAMTKSFKPQINSITGRISDTQYVDELNLKIGARVMLIYNVDVSDLLNNGAIGSVIGIEENQNGKVTSVIVRFDKPDTGKESRKANPMLARKYPGGTVIVKKEFDYSLSKNKGLISTTAKLIQFPLVLAWAVTVHKFQGQTVSKPQKVVVDVRSVFEAAQAYVMFSRVQELNQLYILEELPEDKIYASITAQEEIGRLMNVSINKNPSIWHSNDMSQMRLSFLNCRSMKNKFEHIREDESLGKSDVIVLTETWLDPEQQDEEYKLLDYDVNLNSGGRGKGIATYFNNKFNHVQNIRIDGYSMSKTSAKDLDVIGV